MPDFVGPVVQGREFIRQTSIIVKSRKSCVEKMLIKNLFPNMDVSCIN